LDPLGGPDVAAMLSGALTRTSVRDPVPPPEKVTCSAFCSVRGSLHSSPTLRCSLARRLRDDLLGDVGRDFGIRIELHRVVRSTLSPRPQVTDVSEHFRQ